MLSLMILLTNVAVFAQLDKSHMPQSLCGWPSLHTDGRFPEWNTRIAQYLLGYSLNESVVIVNGIFSDSTTEDIESFQKLMGIDINGYLNSDTWPSLIEMVSPLNASADVNSDRDSLPIMALQDALTANGFETFISGVFDELTVSNLALFQTQTGAEVTSGLTADEETWHLLITSCNVTDSYYWFDAGWPQGKVTTDTLSCLLDTGFEYATFECWRNINGTGLFWTECVDNVANAWEAGFEYVDVYMFPHRYAAPSTQVHELLNNLTINNVKYGAVMIDIEGDDWLDFSQEENRQFMLELRSVFDEENIPMTMYTGPKWERDFGDNFTAFSDLPLIYAHYDNIPSFYDYDYAPYGGWVHASGKQFWDAVDDEIVCNISLDWDWSPTRFWKREE